MIVISGASGGVGSYLANELSKDNEVIGRRGKERH